MIEYWFHLLFWRMIEDALEREDLRIKTVKDLETVYKLHMMVL